MLNKFLEEITISKAYKNLVNIFWLLNANILSNENDIIELKLVKTLLFGLLYNLSKYQLKTVCKYINKNLINRFI